MLKNINVFLQKIFSETYKKEDIIKKLDLAETALNDNAIYMLEEIVDSLKSHKASLDQEKKLQPIFENIGTAHPAFILDSVEELLKFSIGVDKQISNLKKYVSELDEVITDKTMTPKQAGLIGTITNIETIGEFLGELAFYISYVITDTDENLTKASYEKIKTGSNDFRRLYLAYKKGKIAKAVKNISKLSDNIVVHDNTMFKLHANAYDKGFDFPVNKLTINPFYYIGKLFVDLEMLYYDYLKYKKELLEYKIRERENSDDPNIKQQIEYYEKKLAEVEAKMRSIREGYEDEL